MLLNYGYFIGVVQMLLLFFSHFPILFRFIYPFRLFHHHSSSCVYCSQACASFSQIIDSKVEFKRKRQRKSAQKQKQNCFNNRYIYKWQKKEDCSIDKICRAMVWSQKLHHHISKLKNRHGKEREKEKQRQQQRSWNACVYEQTMSVSMSYDKEQHFGFSKITMTLFHTNGYNVDRTTHCTYQMQQA